MPKKYSTAKKTALLKKLEVQDPTTVARTSGVHIGTLRRLASDAGLTLVDGRRKPSAQKEKVPSVKKPSLTNGHRTTSAVSASLTQNGLKIAIHGLEEYIRKCVREEVGSVLRSEIMAMAASLKR